MLEKRKKYLQIALNGSMGQALDIASRLPHGDKILVEAGTPLLKSYGIGAVSRVAAVLPRSTYIVADTKCADLAEREAAMAAAEGAGAATVLGVAPLETVATFIQSCKNHGIDSMVDMMNVENPLAVLKQLKTLPDVVILHRGVDESEFSKEKQIPYYQIKQIKGNFNCLVSVAGGDTINEIQRAFFNDADIVVVWKNFYSPSSLTAQLAQEFLKEIN